MLLRLTTKLKLKEGEEELEGRRRKTSMLLVAEMIEIEFWVC